MHRAHTQTPIGATQLLRRALFGQRAGWIGAPSKGRHSGSRYVESLAWGGGTDAVQDPQSRAVESLATPAHCRARLRSSGCTALGGAPPALPHKRRQPPRRPTIAAASGALAAFGCCILQLVALWTCGCTLCAAAFASLAREESLCELSCGHSAARALIPDARIVPVATSSGLVVRPHGRTCLY